MPQPGRDALADQRQLVVVLRLVAGTTGDLLYGEVIDVESGPIRRFIGWRGMTSALRSWLAHELDAPSAGSEPPAGVPGRLAAHPGRPPRDEQPADR